MSAADDAWQAFKLSVPPEVYPTYEDTFMAAYRSGYRRALQDAADAAGRKATGGLYVSELIALAAAVGVTGDDHGSHGWKATCPTCGWRGRDTTSPHDAARAGDAHVRASAPDACTTKGCGRPMSEHQFGVFCP